MKLYGRTKASKDAPMELSEVTLSANPRSLRELSAFLERCAVEIEEEGDRWEHEHFSSQNQAEAHPQFIGFNPEAL
ncbi:hypothetical protein EDC38_3143 [Marinimicrobium koreense]|uniref:Uncharacterized protein n=1 Tax=Marinimicrobium koreense TaxID=306545 RepID=A0A3N1NQK1_9GAMM|nr:hypothetical protein EDC38_3143 [Marinimicrobium koreense]